VPIITGLAIRNSKLQQRNSFYESLRLKCEFLNRNMSLIDNHILEQEYNSLKGKNNYILSYTSPYYLSVNYFCSSIKDYAKSTSAT
ncbi:hypothetical protein KC219_22245, partial [Mycobacterium tuberculosis]|nr:hypothetical protein [Mycobacterium tuberculosis]